MEKITIKNTQLTILYRNSRRRTPSLLSPFPCSSCRRNWPCEACLRQSKDELAVFGSSVFDWDKFRSELDGVSSDGPSAKDLKKARSIKYFFDQKD